MKLGIVVFLLLIGLRNAIAEDNCLPISQEVTFRITNYLRSTISFATPTPTTPYIETVSSVSDTCFQKLIVKVPGTANPLTIYLSPDQRFLFPAMYDTTIDPRKVALQSAVVLKSRLLSDKSPDMVTGNTALAPRLTLVEFADFECPYCKIFHEWYLSLPKSVLEHTKLIFKQFPLPQHPWARRAALYSSCAGVQRGDAFWLFADYFFSHQQTLSDENFSKELKNLVNRTPNINLEELSRCATGGEGEGIVKRDEALAKELSVSSTPTLFLNGMKLRVSSQSELLRALEYELKESEDPIAASQTAATAGR